MCVHDDIVELIAPFPPPPPPAPMCDAVRCSVWYEAAMFLEDAAKAAQAKVSPQSRLHPGRAIRHTLNGGSERPRRCSCGDGRRVPQTSSCTLHTLTSSSRRFESKIAEAKEVYKSLLVRADPLLILGSFHVHLCHQINKQLTIVAGV